MNKSQIGIVGAGIAGLLAGRQLQRAGYEVSVFEARNRTGGRIQSLQSGPYTIETGPEFIHGHLKETLSLLDEYQIPYLPVSGKVYGLHDNKLSSSTSGPQGWDLLTKTMKSLKEDLVLSDFLHRHYPGDQHEELRSYAKSYAEGFDLADPHIVSTKALIEEWDNEESDQYRIPRGYGTLTDALENDYRKEGGKIFLNTPVAQVSWNETRLTIHTGTKDIFEMDKLIVSVPLSLLQPSSHSENRIQFDPRLNEKEKAFGHLGFGTVIKIVLIWEDAFWNQAAPDALFIFSDHFIPTWWTQHPANDPVLTGWLGGPSAEACAAETDDYFLRKALETLSAIFSVSVQNLKNKLKDHYIFNWKKEPWTRGAYSYGAIGYKQSKAVYSQPVDGKIYFTGEAAYSGSFPGTVEAAVVSGLMTAAQIAV